MATLTDAQIAGYAKNAGVTGDNLALAVAIALAESGGNPAAHNPVPPDNSYGLWQINMIGNLGPTRRKEFGISTNDALFDPAVNARAMFKVSGGGQNWRPWTTYTSGKYRVYMPRGQTAAGTPSTADAGLTVQNVGLGSALGTFSVIISTMSDPHTWVRIGLFMGGLVLLIMGIFKMTGDNKLSEGTKAAAKFIAFRKLPV
jgi:hypothetical protein